MPAIRARSLLLVLPIAVGLALTWGGLGDISETGAVDAPMLELPRRSLDGPALVVGVGLALGWIVLLWRGRGRGALRAAGVRLAIAGLVLGAGVAGGLRIVSSETEGANIGGGLVVLVGPFFAGGLAWYCYRRWREL